MSIKRIKVNIRTKKGLVPMIDVSVYDMLKSAERLLKKVMYNTIPAAAYNPLFDDLLGVFEEDIDEFTDRDLERLLRETPEEIPEDLGWTAKKYIELNRELYPKLYGKQGKLVERE